MHEQQMSTFWEGVVSCRQQTVRPRTRIVEVSPRTTSSSSPQSPRDLLLLKIKCNRLLSVFRIRIRFIRIRIHVLALIWIIIKVK